MKIEDTDVLGRQN